MKSLAFKPWPEFMTDERRACLGTDPEVFFPPPGNSSAALSPAKAICARCPFRAPCRAFAIEHELFGIWGSTTEYERRHARRREPTYEEIATEKRSDDR
jgi:hypothetical protein